HGVDQARVAAEYVEADAPLVARWQAGGQLRPGGSAVTRPVDAAAATAAVESPRLPLTLIRGRKQRLRIARIHHDVGGAGVLVNVEPLLPRRAAIDSLEDATLGVRAPQVPDRGDVDHIRVRRIDDDAPDVARVGESRGAPRPAGIDRLVNAVPPRRTLAVVGFA